MLDDGVSDDGAVGFALSGSVRLSTVVSQGCRPVGVPLIVTGAERNVIFELAGKPARQRLTELSATSQTRSGDGRPRAPCRPRRRRAPHRVPPRRLPDPQRRSASTRDRALSSSATMCRVGSDGPVPGARRRDRRRRPARAARPAGDGAAGALVFTCNGRGTRLFEMPDHDAAVVADLLGPIPLRRLFCAGEIGPVGVPQLHPRLHGVDEIASRQLVRLRSCSLRERGLSDVGDPCGLRAAGAALDPDAPDFVTAALIRTRRGIPARRGIRLDSQPCRLVRLRLL